MGMRGARRRFTSPVMINVTPQDRAALDAIAEARGLSVSAVGREAVRRFLRAQDDREDDVEWELEPTTSASS